MNLRAIFVISKTILDTVKLVLYNDLYMNIASVINRLNILKSYLIDKSSFY